MRARSSARPARLWSRILPSTPTSAPWQQHPSPAGNSAPRAPLARLRSGHSVRWTPDRVRRGAVVMCRSGAGSGPLGQIRRRSTGPPTTLAAWPNPARQRADSQRLPGVGPPSHLRAGRGRGRGARRRSRPARSRRRQRRDRPDGHRVRRPPTELNETELPEKSVIKPRISLLATFYDQNRVIVPLTEISPYLQHAVIATEESGSTSTPAWTPRACSRAFVKNQTADSGGQEGASTLTQHTSRTCSSTRRSPRAPRRSAWPRCRRPAVPRARGYARKLREAKLAIALVKRGDQGPDPGEVPQHRAVRGVRVRRRVRGQYYFSKPAKDLTYPRGRDDPPASRRAPPSGPVLKPGGRRRAVATGCSCWDEGAGLHTPRRSTRPSRATPLADTTTSPR